MIEVIKEIESGILYSILTETSVPCNLVHHIQKMYKFSLYMCTSSPPY